MSIYGLSAATNPFWGQSRDDEAWEDVRRGDLTDEAYYQRVINANDRILRQDQEDLFPQDAKVLKRIYDYGVETGRKGRPREVAINDEEEGELIFGPVPDGPYRVASTYIRAPEIWDPNKMDDPTEDGAEPTGLPARFHEAIKWKALRLLAEYDEADALVLQTTELNFRRYYDAMKRDLLRRGGVYVDFQGGLGGSLGGRSFGVGAFGPAPTTGFGTPQ